MTGGVNASVSSTRSRPSASIPVLSISPAGFIAGLWGFLGFDSSGLTEFFSAISLLGGILIASFASFASFGFHYGFH